MENENVIIVADSKDNNKRKRKIIMFSVFGVLFALGVVFSLLTLLFEDFINWTLYTQEKINGGNIGKQLTPEIPIIILFTVLSLVVFVTSFFVLAKALKSHKKICKIISLCIAIVLVVYYSIIAFVVTDNATSSIEWAQNEITKEKQQRLEEEQQRLEEEQQRLKEEQARIAILTPKFTDTTILELRREIQRYPLKYDGATVKVEGYATGCKLDEFELCFPFSYSYIDSIENGRRLYLREINILNFNYQVISSYSSIDVCYTINKNNPRVLENDYVVVTGTLDVYVDDTTGDIEVVLMATNIEIKPDPN